MYQNRILIFASVFLLSSSSMLLTLNESRNFDIDHLADTSALDSLKECNLMKISKMREMDKSASITWTGELPNKVWGSVWVNIDGGLALLAHDSQQVTAVRIQTDNTARNEATVQIHEISTEQQLCEFINYADGAGVVFLGCRSLNGEGETTIKFVAIRVNIAKDRKVALEILDSREFKLKVIDYSIELINQESQVKIVIASKKELSLSIISFKSNKFDSQISTLSRKEIPTLSDKDFISISSDSYSLVISQTKEGSLYLSFCYVDIKSEINCLEDQLLGESHVTENDFLMIARPSKNSMVSNILTISSKNVYIWQVLHQKQPMKRTLDLISRVAGEIKDTFPMRKINDLYQFGKRLYVLGEDEIKFLRSEAFLNLMNHLHI